ncbi:MAG: TonB-dependent receptor plug domain-containing protein [Candidatus Latescibacterota bacterium]
MRPALWAACLLAGAPAGAQDSLSTVFTLGEVVVRGQRAPTIEEAATTTQITRADLRARADGTLDEALAAAPGGLVGVHTKGHTRIQLRGFDQDRTTVLLDGIPLNDVYAADLDLAGISVASLGRITVVRGTASALYGTAGAAGAISGISRRPTRPYLEARAQYGAGEWALDLSHGASAGPWYYWTSAASSGSGGFRPSARLDRTARTRWLDRLLPYGLYGYFREQLDLPATASYLRDTGRWDHSEHRQWEVSGKLGRQWGSAVEAGVLGRYQGRHGKSNTYDLNAFSDYKLQSGVWRDPVFALTSPRDVKKAALRNRAFVWPEVYAYQASPYVRWTRGRAELRLLAYRSFRRAVEEGYASTDHAYAKDQAAVLGGEVSDPYADLKTYVTNGANLVAGLRRGDGHRLALSCLVRSDSYAEQQQALSATASPHLAATSYGVAPYHVQYLEAAYLSLAAEEEARLGPGVSLAAGVSYDAQNLLRFRRRRDLYYYGEAYRAAGTAAFLGTRDALSPVVGLVLGPAGGWLTLHASASLKTRFPSLGEYAKIDSVGDRQLRSERLRSASAGMEVHLGRGGLRLRSDYYYTAVRDRIAKIAGGSEPPVNIDEVVSQGVESQLAFATRRATGLGPLRGTVSHVYLRARNRDDSAEETVNKGERLDFLPTHQFLWDLRWEPAGSTEVSVWGTHTRGQVAYVMRVRPAPDDPSVPYSTDYFGTVPLHQPVELSARVARRVGSGLQVYAVGANLLDDYGADPFNPGPGRTFRVGWLYER